MFNRKKRYINTITDGMIVQFEHNLDNVLPTVSLWEPAGNPGDYKTVPLYDSRIASIESKGKDITQFSFTAPFEGYVELLTHSEDYFTIEERIQDLERRINDVILNQKRLVGKNQWSQMNTLNDNDHKDFKKDIEQMKEDLVSLRNDIDNL